MARKSEHIQIRVSPEQKATLKRRAARAGEDLSSYILARVLLPERARWEEILAVLAGGDDRRFALAALNDLLTELPPSWLAEVTRDADLGGLSPVTRNYVAAMVERAAQLGGAEAPVWTRRVEPLEDPYFVTPLKGLRLHLLKASPLAFKRRNLFVDASLGDRV